MKLTFIGADHEVTGSCHMLEIAGKYVLVDYGLEQGADLYQNAELPIPAAMVSYVLLTHAHIDHAGMIPLLYKEGFRGKVVTTRATENLCDLMLRDSAHIQEFEAEWRNRKAKRSGGKLFEPKYTMADVEGLLGQFYGVEYDEIVTLDENIQVRFTDAGHLLGSAGIEVFVTENGETRTILFSGDIGNINKPIIRDPQYGQEADFVVMESTYGDRVHGEKPDYVGELTRIMQDTFDRGGNLVIPCFAVGRTQEMLYFIRKIVHDKLIRGHEGFEVYVDSPMAVEATKIFAIHPEEYFDEEAMELVRQGIDPIAFPGLRLSVTSEDSKAINFDNKPKVIISASGMCEAGRIRHHLKHNLWKPESTILFVGYQSNGTVGRMLMDGAEEIKLFGEPVTVRAKIENLNGISGHADKNGLINWLKNLGEKPRQVFVVHGEDQVAENFAKELCDVHGYKAMAPYSGTVYDILAERFEEVTIPVLAEKKQRQQTKGVNAAFQRLLEAGQRLMGVIQQNKGGANKDLGKFADQILALCKKWER